jgi:hypothetical protein
MYATDVTLALKEWSRCAITPRSFIRIAKEREKEDRELDSFELLYYRWS